MAVDRYHDRITLSDESIARVANIHLECVGRWSKPGKLLDVKGKLPPKRRQT
jgi:hypothetical protein